MTRAKVVSIDIVRPSAKLQSLLTARATAREKTLARMRIRLDRITSTIADIACDALQTNDRDTQRAAELLVLAAASLRRRIK